MANCAPKPLNPRCISRLTYRKLRPILSSPPLVHSSSSRLFPGFKLRLISAIKEKESVSARSNGKPSETTVNGVPVDELAKPVRYPASSDEDQFDRGEGFDLNWPPWKNLPQRYKLVGTTSLAFVICNMDKVNLSIAIIPMPHQFVWNSSVAGLVQSSFFWGYALSQLPGGWLSKIFGGRQVLAIGVLVWSMATALVPSVAGFMPGLIFSRILVGIGEGVSPSAATDLIARVNTIGGAFMSSCFCFWWDECWKCCRDVPWKAFFRTPAVWAMIYAHFCGSWGHYSCLSWLPTNLIIYSIELEELDLNLTEAAWVSVLPPLASIVVQCCSTTCRQLDCLWSRNHHGEEDLPNNCFCFPRTLHDSFFIRLGVATLGNCRDSYWWPSPYKFRTFRTILHPSKYVARVCKHTPALHTLRRVLPILLEQYLALSV